MPEGEKEWWIDKYSIHNAAEEGMQKRDAAAAAADAAREAGKKKPRIDFDPNADDL